jgi:hypothetical protein
VDARCADVAGVSRIGELAPHRQKHRLGQEIIYPSTAVVMTELTQLKEATMPDDLLNTHEMSQYLFDTYRIKIRPGTLRARRSEGIDAPEFIKVGHNVFYRRSAGDAYAKRAISAPMRSTRDQRVPAIA